MTKKMHVNGYLRIFKLTMIQAVIFDMDGLLIDSEPLWREAEITIFNSIGLNFTEDMCRQTMGMRIDEVVIYWYNQFQWNTLSVDKVADLIVDEVIRLILEKGKALEGVYSTFEMLKSKKIPMAIASSSSMRIINTVVDTFQIKHHFDVIHSAEYEKYGKPHPQVFISTATKLNVQPENCLVFEDSKHGMIAALSAKMNVIVIPENPSKNENWHDLANQKLNSLEEFEISDWKL